MHFVFNQIPFAPYGSKALLLITTPQLLLAMVVAGLLVLMVKVCIQSTTGPVSTAALKHHLFLLQQRMAGPGKVQPQQEREELEKLQNTIKTSSTPDAISGDVELRSLFRNNCASIQSKIRQPELEDRSGWIQFGELISGFNASYFPG
jgi:hypothetical protein